LEILKRKKKEKKKNIPGDVVLSIPEDRARNPSVLITQLT